MRVKGHFGEWIQGRLGPDGPIGLITVPCPILFAEARRLGDGPLVLDQEPFILDLGRASALLAALGVPAGRFRLTANMLPGGGAGASTAALLAFAGAAGAADIDLGQACLAAEGATDPLMLDQPGRVLWAPRQARVVRSLPDLPAAEIVGGFWGAVERTDPADIDFDNVEDLTSTVQPGMTLDAFAELASESARRCTARRGPSSDPTADIATDLGALGYVRAHTGSARGLIYPPGQVPEHATEALKAAGYDAVLQFRTEGH